MARILLVESDRLLRQILTEVLQSENFDVLDTNSREEGLRLAIQWVPNVIVCDAMFPIQLGNFLDRLHEHPTTANIPIIVLATSSAIEPIYTLISSKTTYWVRPLNIPILLETIARLGSCSHSPHPPSEFQWHRLPNLTIQPEIAEQPTFSAIKLLRIASA